MKNAEDIKSFYEGYEDEIFKKRFHSSEPLRRYVHRSQYSRLIELVPEGMSVLDSGCGQGVISILLAEKGILSTGVDISRPNVAAAMVEAEKRHVSHLTKFVQGDAEALPFPDNSFDVVISAHVLEHLPNFETGVRELTRVARKRIIVALPTCLNLSSAALLGGDYGFWTWSKRSFIALPWGVLRVLFHFLDEGVQEGYAGFKDLPHIRRYPWVMRRQLRKLSGWKIVHFEAASLILPYFKSLLPVTKWLDQYRSAPVLRNCGYGSIAVLEPQEHYES